MTIAIPVSDVELARTPMKALERDAALRSALNKRVEALYSSPRTLVRATDTHSLAEAASYAFYKHYPLVLSPDAVWFCLAQGFAHHVSLNAERLRHRFVKHEGKKKLVIERPDFFLGQENPWPEAFTAFSEQIAGHVGKLRELVVADFSTTGPIERAASEVLVMDAFQPYFEYEMMCGCGIPSITLLGTVEDWRSVRRRAAMLSEFELESWTRVLMPVLDEVVRTAEGHGDRTFWQSFFRHESSSGGNELTGWINVLFPYIHVWNEEKGANELGPNPYFERWEEGFQSAEKRKMNGEWLRWGTQEGPALPALPSGVASAPVRFVDVRDGSVHPLRFVGGLLGVVQDPQSLALMPEFGWAIIHDV